MVAFVFLFQLIAVSLGTQLNLTSVKASELPKATVRRLQPERGRCLFLEPGQNAESAEVSVRAAEDVDGQSGGARCAGELLRVASVAAPLLDSQTAGGASHCYCTELPTVAVSPEPARALLL